MTRITSLEFIGGPRDGHIENWDHDHEPRPVIETTETREVGVTLGGDIEYAEIIRFVYRRLPATNPRGHRAFYVPDDVWHRMGVDR